MNIEISLPDAKALLALLQSSPEQWPDVIEELEIAIENTEGNA